jgi:hypothetical protein
MNGRQTYLRRPPAERFTARHNFFSAGAHPGQIACLTGFQTVPVGNRLVLVCPDAQLRVLPSESGRRLCSPYAAASSGFENCQTSV